MFTHTSCRNLPHKFTAELRENERGNKVKENNIYAACAREKTLILSACNNKLISLPLRTVNVNCYWDFHCGDGLKAGQGAVSPTLDEVSWGGAKSIAIGKTTSPSIILPAEKGRKASRLLYWPLSRKCSGLKVSGVSHTFLSNIIEVRLVITVVPCERWRNQAITWWRRADVLSD